MALVEHLGERCAAHTLAVPPALVGIPRLVIPPPPDFEAVNPPAPVPPAGRRREPPPDHMRCTGIKKSDGQRCTARRKDGERCGKHPIGDAPPAGGICTGTKGGGQPCDKRATTDGLCGLHFRSNNLRLRKVSAEEWHDSDVAAIEELFVPQERERRVLTREVSRLRLRPTEAERADQNLAENIRERQVRIMELRDLMKTRKAGILKQLNMAPVEPLAEEGVRLQRSFVRVNNALQLYTQARAIAQIRAERVRQRREAFDARRQAIIANPLGRFANDRQNVHTAETNMMLRDVETRLVEATPAQHVIHEIRWCWFELGVGTSQVRNTVLADVEHWYATEYVRVPGDFAYKNMLDRVWGLIKKSRHREDMEKRLWEEALESVGMCADGHLTRLANAVQGFDESDAPVLEVPKSERLQTAMAQISELDPGERESAARRIFAELGMDEDAQRPWLEALEA